MIILFKPQDLPSSTSSDAKTCQDLKKNTFIIYLNSFYFKILSIRSFLWYCKTQLNTTAVQTGRSIANVDGLMTWNGTFFADTKSFSDDTHMKISIKSKTSQMKVPPYRGIIEISYKNSTAEQIKLHHLTCSSCSTFSSICSETYLVLQLHLSRFSF